MVLPGDKVLEGGLTSPGRDFMGAARARSHCRFVLLLAHFIPDSLTCSVPLYLKRQCDRTLGTPLVAVAGHAAGRGAAAAAVVHRLVDAGASR